MVAWFAPVGLGVTGPAVQYVGGNSSLVTTTTYSFSSTNIGTGPSFLVLGVTGSSSVARTISNVTVASIAASSIVASPSQVCAAGLFGISVAAGGTATISVTFSGSMQACAVDVWALTKLNSTTATSTNLATASNPSASITPSSRGIVIACAATNATTTASWSGGVTQYSSYGAAGTTPLWITSAAAYSLPATLITPQATFVSNANSTIVMAAFR